MSEDKKVQYIIEAIDASDAGVKSAESNVKKVTASTVTLQNASDARIRAAIAGLRKERSELQETTTKVNNLTTAHVRNDTIARSSMSQQFNYSKRLTGQFNELATRIMGIGGAYATIRYLSNSLKDAGINTEIFDKNVASVSATIGTELLPIAENGMKWFNENYQVITQTVLNFGKTFQIVFGGLSALPIGAAAAFYKLRPAIDYALGIRGPALDKAKKEAETLGKSYAESFKAEIDKIQNVVTSMSDLPEMKTPKRKDDDKKKAKELVYDQGNQNVMEPAFLSNGLLESNIESYKSYLGKQEQLKIEQNEKLKALQYEAAETEIMTNMSGFDQQYALLEMSHQRELEQYAGIAGAKTSIDEIYADKKSQIEKDSAKKTADILEKEKQMKLQNFQQIGGAFNNLMGAIGEATKENAKAQKAVSIIQAVINTALGVTQAFAQGGVAGFVTGALVAAAGAVQIATIASQNFALGGVAKRNPGAVSDSVNINVNPDERIVTKRQQNNLTRFLNNPNGQAGGDTFNIHDESGDLVERLITKIRSGAGDRLSRELRTIGAFA